MEQQLMQHLDEEQAYGNFEQGVSNEIKDELWDAEGFGEFFQSEDIQTMLCSSYYGCDYIFIELAETIEMKWQTYSAEKKS